MVMSLFMAGVLANISARNPEAAPLSFWQSLRTNRARVSKNRPQRRLGRAGGGRGEVVTCAC